MKAEGARKTIRRVIRRKDGSVVKIVLRYPHGESEWTVERMKLLARNHDNGAPYYLVKTRRSARDLERLFRQRVAAVMLEETVGSIYGGYGLTEPGIIVMQIDRRARKAGDEELLAVCLSDIGVEVLTPTSRPF